MNISKWTHAGTILKMNALNYPDKLGWQDKSKEFTFKEWNDRSCRFANGLTAMGVGHKDSFAVLAYNRGEWMDIYAGCAKGGQMVVPIMFRLAAPDIEYITGHSECKAIVVEAPFVELINGIRDKLSIPKENYIYLGEGPAPKGYVGYEDFLAKASPAEPDLMVDSADIWCIMYTSGTTGRPERGHENP